MIDYEDLDYDDLCHLIGEYSNYVTEFYRYHDEGSEYPVCIWEFYENEYQEILKENEK